MYCRNCGKELSDNAIACTGCGMNPKEGSNHCPACGEKTVEKQIICTACGASLEHKDSAGWTTGAYVGLIILSFFVPLFGWIYGGIKASNSPDNSKRKSQALHYVFAGIGGAILNLLIFSSE